MSKFKPTSKAEIIEHCNNIIEDHHYKKNRTKSPSSKRSHERVLQLFLSIKHHLVK